MQRVRRLAFVAVLALAAGLVLSGCRSQPGAAIYIGSAKYTEKYVDGLSDQLTKLPGLSRGDGRRTIVQWIVIRDLGKRMVSDKNWAPPQVDEQAASSQFMDAMQGDPALAQKVIAAIRPLIRLYAQYQGYIAAAQEHVTPAKPTDADYADLYARAKAAGLVQAGMDEATYRENLGPQNEELLASNLGLRNLYSDVIKKSDVSINPKYAPAELTLLHDSNNNPLVVIPLNAKAGQPAVVPAPAEPAAPAPAGG
jgi:hypothetical protein